MSKQRFSQKGNKVFSNEAENKMGSTTRLGIQPIGLLVVSLALAACSSTGSRQVIVEDRTEGTSSVEVRETPGATPEREAPTVTYPTQEDNNAPAATPQSGSVSQPSNPPTAIEPQGAVLALLEQAEIQHQQGQNQLALSTLERAQRIAPRQPAVYLQMARLLKDMEQTAESQQMARKGLSLSGNDSRLINAFNALLR